MKSKKTYPALYRWAFATGRENDLIPLEQQKKIPKQTKSNWRLTPKKDIQLLEEELEIREQLETLIDKQDLQWFAKRKLFIGITRLHISIISMLGKDTYLRLLDKSKAEFIQLIEKHEDYFSKSDLLRWFHVSPNQYQVWYSEVHYNCKSSHLQLCAKRHPFQITTREFKQIETNLQDKQYINWPRSAIHSHLLKKGELLISRSTFYKHAGIIEPLAKKRRIRKPAYTPLRATYVNEYWHLDISHFKTKDGEASYIYAVVDNYSRKIIALAVHKEVSQKKVGQILCDALEQVTLQKLFLITDGGPENKNRYIAHLLDQFNKQQEIRVDHKIALKDIIQSNSMIERIFHTMKYNYLYTERPENHENLKEALRRFMLEYNHIRPHYSLHHLTPAEAFDGKAWPDMKQPLKSAMVIRFRKNKGCKCRVCTCV